MKSGRPFHLRKKLEMATGGRLIQTGTGIGYQPTFPRSTSRKCGLKSTAKTSKILAVAAAKVHDPQGWCATHEVNRISHCFQELSEVLTCYFYFCILIVVRALHLRSHVCTTPFDSVEFATKFSTHLNLPQNP